MAKSKSNQYAVYAQEGRFNKNLVAKLERHVRKHPNDEAAKAALKNAATKQYSRKSSGTKGNFPDQKITLRDAAGNIVLAWTVNEWVPTGKR